MRAFYTRLLFLISGLLLINCSKSDDSNPESVRLRLSGEFISCLQCDSDFGFRHYVYDNDRDLHLSLKFDINIADNYSLDSFKGNFHEARFIIFNAKKRTDSSVFLIHNTDNLITELNQMSSIGLAFDLTEYKNNRLKGFLKGTALEITEVIWSDSPDCITGGDVVGTCDVTTEANIPVDIEFDFLVP